MTISFYDRVKETSTSTGLTSVALGGAATGYRAFSSVYSNAAQAYYCIADQSGSNWEVGTGTYLTSGNVLGRNTVAASSNSNNLVNFASGSLYVFGTQPAFTVAGNPLAKEITNQVQGDQSILSQDASFFRTGSWSTTASGDLYTLLGDFAMYYWTHNTALDSNGNFLGRDEAATCTLWVFTESGLIKIYNAVTASAGVVPVWTLVSTQDTSTGILTCNLTGTSSITNALASATTTVNVSSATAPTTGQVLTATGASAATWKTPQLVLLGTATASSSSSLTFASMMSSAYSQYELVFEDLVTSAGATIGLQVAVDNATFTTQMVYQKSVITLGGTAGPSYTGASATTPSVLAQMVGATAIYTGFARFVAVANTFLFSSFIGAMANSLWDKCDVSTPTTINAIRFLPSAGNFTSGKIYLYGVKNT